MEKRSYQTYFSCTELNSRENGNQNRYVELNVIDFNDSFKWVNWQII